MGSASPPPSSGALGPGHRLDRYELICVLAQGGMGTVWLARLLGKLNFERLVAVKTILATYTHDRQFGDMFLDEARIAARIDHENVARILEIGEDRGFLYYAMDLVDGQSLRKLHRDVKASGDPFPLGVALRVMADAAGGLHATHELRGADGQLLEVVHRDVSPQNLLVNVRGQVKLIDFGVAKARSRLTEETAAGILKGKLEYMAPEQTETQKIDRRADIYALGAVVYELLSGKPVVDASEGKQLQALAALMSGKQREPLPMATPDAVRAVIDRAIAADPSQRFATADELRLAIERTGYAGTHDDVAAAMAHYSKDRSARRKRAIDEAVRAHSEDRIQVATLVQPVASLPAPPPSRPIAQTIPLVGMGTTPPPPSSSSVYPSSAPDHGPPTASSLPTFQGAAISTSTLPQETRPSSGIARGMLAVSALLAVAIAGGRRRGRTLQAPNADDECRARARAGRERDSGRCSSFVFRRVGRRDLELTARGARRARHGGPREARTA